MNGNHVLAATVSDWRGLANILAVAIAQVDGLDNAGPPKILSGMWRVL